MLPPRQLCDRVNLSFLCRTGSRSCSCPLRVQLSLFSQDPVRIHLEGLLVILSIFWALIRSDSLYLALTCSFSAMICPFISPGLWMSSFSFTHTILFTIFISSSGTRFVLTFELHDSSLNGFLETAILSSSSPPRTYCTSKLYVPEDGSVCNSLSRCLIFSSANIMHRLS